MEKLQVQLYGQELPQVPFPSKKVNLSVSCIQKFSQTQQQLCRFLRPSIFTDIKYNYALISLNFPLHPYPYFSVPWLSANLSLSLV